jgi:hypothetical protein
MAWIFTSEDAKRKFGKASSIGRSMWTLRWTRWRTEVEGMEWTEGVLVDEFGDEMEEELWTMGEE